MKSSVLVAACASIAAFILYCPLATTAHSQEVDGAALSAEESIPDAKTKPIDIHGCWTGPMDDSISGAGTITFTIKQSKTKIVKDNMHNHGSRVDVEYATTGFAKGPIGGTITGTSITFSAVFGGGCGANGAATIVNSNDITGTLDYTNCASGFGHVTYEVSHC